MLLWLNALPQPCFVDHGYQGTQRMLAWLSNVSDEYHVAGYDERTYIQL